MLDTSRAISSEPYTFGSVLYNADEFVATYVASRIPNARFNQYVALGVVRRGQFIGGAVFHNYLGHSIEVAIAFDRPDWSYPGTLRQLFSYPFNELGCVRMNAVISRKNKRSRRFVKGLGFKEEGIARKGFDGVDDAVIYGMLRDECKFLRT